MSAQQNTAVAAPSQPANSRAPRAGTPAETPAKPRSLPEALLAFAAEAPKLRRDATGQIQNRTYTYATLDGMLDDLVPLLVKHELLWQTYPATLDGHPALRYRLTHVPSRESDQDVMLLCCSRADPQAQGSALSYARRYALLAVLNLAPGDDDDGRAASVMPNMQVGAQPLGKSSKAEEPKRAPRLASAAQQRLITSRAEHANLGADDLAALILSASGSEPMRFANPQDAAAWTARALQRLDARHVNGLLAAITKQSEATR